MRLLNVRSGPDLPLNPALRRDMSKHCLKKSAETLSNSIGNNVDDISFINSVFATLCM